jgi:hypothetical protein
LCVRSIGFERTLLAHFDDDGVDMCFFYFDVRKKNVILHFNIKYMYRVVLALVLK